MKFLSWVWFAIVVSVTFYLFILTMGIVGVAVGSYNCECVKILRWTIGILRMGGL